MIICGDCLGVMRGMDANSVDAIITDPPAGISFMGKDWDHDKGGRDKWIEWMAGIARECLRALKPGGHALVWALPRTSHWTATAWENAGFEVRERIAHVFGSGFPKSLDVSKAIDKTAGAKRERRLAPTRAGNSERRGQGEQGATYGDIHGGFHDESSPMTDTAREWEDWGTALKPAMEDWWLLRKPLSENTVAANILKWGTGAINVGGCRIPVSDMRSGGFGKGHRPWIKGDIGHNTTYEDKLGRWPANIIHDGSDEVMELFPQTPGQLRSVGPEFGKKLSVNTFGDYGPRQQFGPRGDSSSAARFFYCAKASRKEREMGCEGMPEKRIALPGKSEGYNPQTGGWSGNSDFQFRSNHHPTVKPIALMRYLCRLITPPNGLILDPFMGSGTTLIAAEQEGFRAIGIEVNEEYCEIAKRRIYGTLNYEEAKHQ